MVHHEQNQGEMSLQILVLFPLIYLCACTYYSLFQLGIFRSYYFMVPRCTSAFSLLVNAALMCRFAPPLCYNFLHIIHVDDPNDGMLYPGQISKHIISCFCTLIAFS
mmetsp:Transcript_15853/g.40278  ORF Transcript_15853/g.40278 Transcript_15853/m.40278 type:complete len:107 (-) Transcript_15853:740-1060(-)